MSRSSSGAACALLALIGLALGQHLNAQQADDPFGQDKPATTAPAKPAMLDAEDHINAVLDAKLIAPLEFVDTPIGDVVALLGDEYELPIQFEFEALDELAISTDVEVNMNLRNVTLRSALNLIFKTPGLGDLTYIIDDEVLLITTQDRADAALTVVVYRVDDLLDVAPQEKGQFTSLKDLIPRCVEFDSWEINGTGEGELHLMKPGMLVVSQTRRVHVKVDELLDKLRHVKREIEKEEVSHFIPNPQPTSFVPSP